MQRWCLAAGAATVSLAAYRILNMEAAKPQEQLDTVDSPVPAPDPGTNQNAVVQSLGERMKTYEVKTGPEVSPSQYLVIRADGHRFSTFTKGFRKPFDLRISNAMLRTMDDLVVAFNAVTGYTQSDEITLILPEVTEVQRVHIYNGRTQKIASSVAGLCSARFNFHMCAQTFGPGEETLRDAVRSCRAYFDARVIAFPDKTEVANHMVWRSLYDCVRNSTSNLARYHLGHKGCMHKKGGEMRQLLRDMKAAPPAEVKRRKPRPPEAGTTIAYAWEDQPGHFRFGVYSKKEMYTIAATDRKTGEAIEAQRSRLVHKSFEVSTQHSELLFAKFWPNQDLGEVPV